MHMGHASLYVYPPTFLLLPVCAQCTPVFSSAEALKELMVYEEKKRLISDRSMTELCSTAFRNYVHWNTVKSSR